MRARSVRKMWIVCGFMLLATPGAAQDETPPEEPPPPAREEAEPPPPDSDDVFIPTEEIPADEEVTFPVNI